MTGILDLYNEKHENNLATFREQLTLICKWSTSATLIWHV